MTDTALFTYPASGGIQSYKAHSGQRVEVIEPRPCGGGGIIYPITAADGWEGHAYPEELTEWEKKDD